MFIFFCFLVYRIYHSSLIVCWKILSLIGVRFNIFIDLDVHTSIKTYNYQYTYYYSVKFRV